MERKIIYTHRRSFSIVLLVAGAATPASAALLYEADFSQVSGFSHTQTNPPATGPQTSDGANYTLSYSATPRTDAAANFFRTDTVTRALRSLDFGGKHQFLSDPIDVTGHSALTATYVGGTSGFEPFNAMNEFFEWFYVLDGVEASLGTVTQAGPLDLTAGVPDGSSLRLGLRADIDGGDDGFNVTGVTLRGEPIPEPAAGTLLAVGLACLGLRRRGL